MIVAIHIGCCMTRKRFARLHEVADIGPEQASNLITRQNARRKTVVSCNLALGANLGDTVAAIRSVIDPIAREMNCTVHYGGQFEAQRSATATLAWSGGLIVIIMILLLHLALGGDLIAAFLVLINVPLALIGGIAALFIAESPQPFTNLMALLGFGGTWQAPVVSIASLVGFITLFGIAVRNGILLVNHIRWLRIHEHLELDAAVRRGSEERLVPVLMTALSAALGLIPLAIRYGEPGSELLAPLAIVVLGGLLTSTILNMLVVPIGYRLFCHRLPTVRDQSDDLPIT
jgi:HME family heavy-metal exporter